MRNVKLRLFFAFILTGCSISGGLSSSPMNIDSIYSYEYSDSNMSLSVTFSSFSSRLEDQMPYGFLVQVLDRKQEDFYLAGTIQAGQFGPGLVTLGKNLQALLMLEHIAQGSYRFWDARSGRFIGLVDTSVRPPWRPGTLWDPADGLLCGETWHPGAKTCPSPSMVP